MSQNSPFEKVDCVFGLEVLVLDECPRPTELNCSHELVHELVILIALHAGLLQA